MCGLFGVISRVGLSPSKIDRARQARDLLSHRGPDQHGEWLDAYSFHGHRRLSILDLSEVARQPMEEDGVVITVNGEVYNFKGLREELRAVGHIFRSNSDSEVVLHGYRAWGVEGLAQRIDGMYAVTIYDCEKKKLYALRDRAGIKPLYWFMDGNEFIWASELKAICHYLGKARLVMDPEAAIDFLTYKYIPAPKSFYRNVFKLPQAQILQFDLHHWQSRNASYWQLPDKVRSDTEDKLRDELRSLLGQSVKEQLVSDVPIGLLLSGGVDSSAIAVHAAAHKDNLDSFSIGFPGALDETSFATLVANHLSVTHHNENFEQLRVFDYFRDMADMFDEPFGDSSALPTSQVCAFARRFVTVALSGDGGDECFGGYNRYKKFAKLGSSGRFRLAMSQLRSGQWRQLLNFDPVRAYALLRGSLPQVQIAQWKKKLGVHANYDELWAYRAQFSTMRSFLHNARVMDFYTYLPENILTKLDRTSMRHSLEARPPFLSRALIEFAYQLPDSFLMNSGQLKYGLKSTLTNDLPHVILHRPKKGFGIPIAGWKKKISSSQMTLEETFLERVLRGELLHV